MREQVWVCSGQSNMEDPVLTTVSRNESYQLAASGKYDHIRIYQTGWRLQRKDISLQDHHRVAQLERQMCRLQRRRRRADRASTPSPPLTRPTRVMNVWATTRQSYALS